MYELALYPMPDGDHALCMKYEGVWVSVHVSYASHMSDDYVARLIPLVPATPVQETDDSLIERFKAQLGLLSEIDEPVPGDDS